MGKSFKENPGKYRNRYTPDNNKKKDHTGHKFTKPHDPSPDEDWEKFSLNRRGESVDED